VKNPLRDEGAAFQLVLLVLGASALVVVASLIAPWLGVVVFVLLLLGASLAIRGGVRERRAASRIVNSGPNRRILVLANETVGGRELLDVLQTRSRGMNEEVLVVCPALNSRLRTWTSDEDGARAAAQTRLDASIAALASGGVRASGTIGDGDPLQALEDALRAFPADEIVISTHPPGRSHWLERGVVHEASSRYDVPVTHVVVDLDRM
jgi:hypothetical protein